MDAVAIEADSQGFHRLARALDDESDGSEFDAGLAAGLHAALAPGVAAVRSELMSMATSGLAHAGEPLRPAVSASVSSRVNRAGATIRASTIGVRGFRHAPRRLNATSWRHPIPGGLVWVTQVGQPDWFDGPLGRLHPRLLDAAQEAMQDRAQRIARRAP